MVEQDRVRDQIKITGVIAGDPFDRGTWSGISHHLFGALREAGALAHVADARPPGFVEPLAKVASFSPRSMRRWRERHEFSPVTRVAQSLTGGLRARRLDPRPDVLLQIGAYYDFSRIPGLRPGLRCSYHDANLALYAREWNYIEDPRAAHIRRTMAAERRLFDRLDLILTMSDWLRRSFIDDFKQDPAKVVTVGLGANVPATPPEVERDWTSPCFLFVGFDWRRKGGSDVLEAFRKVRARFPGAEFWVVGPEAQASSDGVTWFGRIDRRSPAGDREIERLHRKATAFVMPSIFEPFGNAFLEAMAWGLPCIGSDRCAMPETIIDGETGFIVPVRDSTSLAGAMESLASDPARARDMGRAGRARYLERYTWKVVTERMLTAMQTRLAR